MLSVGLVDAETVDLEDDSGHVPSGMLMKQSAGGFDVITYCTLILLVESVISRSKLYFTNI